MIVELAGPSGVGKSTLARALLGRGAAEPERLGLAAAKGLVANTSGTPEVRDFCLVLAKTFATATGPRRDERRSFTIRSLARLLAARKQKNEVLQVLDGGLVRRGHGIHDVRSAVPIADYYWHMPAADLTIFLLAPETEIEARNKARGGVQDRSADVARMLMLDGLAVLALEKRGKRVAFVDALRPPEQNADVVLGLIRGAARTH